MHITKISFFVFDRIIKRDFSYFYIFYYFFSLGIGPKEGQRAIDFIDHVLGQLEQARKTIAAKQQEEYQFVTKVLELLGPPTSDRSANPTLAATSTTPNSFLGKRNLTTPVSPKGTPGLSASISAVDLSKLKKRNLAKDFSTSPKKPKTSAAYFATFCPQTSSDEI